MSDATVPVLTYHSIDPSGSVISTSRDKFRAQMQANGIGVGAHPLDHPDLSQLAIGDATREIVGSTTLIQERLGTDVQLFAYPYGRDTAQVRAAVRQHCAGACATEVRVKTSASGRHRLPRIDMDYFSRNDRFHELGRAPFQRYVAWRRAWRFVRPVDAWRARR